MSLWLPACRLTFVKPITVRPPFQGQLPVLFRISAARFALREFSKRPDHTHLLVDADNQSIKRIKSAMQVFDEKKLHVSVFASPWRSQIKKWQQFFDSKHINFRPVERVGGTSDPTDEAIKSEALELVKDRGICCIALLTNDRGYIDLVRKLKSEGKDVVVIMPKLRSYSARPLYEAEHAKVVSLDPPNEVLLRVQAVLEADGSGSVSLLNQPLPADEFFKETAQLRCFLERLRYARDDTSLVPSIAKFWQQHSLGPLRVYPGVLALKSLGELLSNTADVNAWQRYHPEVAFVLPVSSYRSKPSKHDILMYGSSKARSVFKGGGPFILTDSEDLTMRVLARLGYFDDGPNADLAEALMVFANNTTNKHNLRKKTVLPKSSDSCDDVVQKIRGALLSSAGAGQWEIAPSDESVKQLLRACKLLGAEEDLPEKVFDAMKAYSQAKRLPERRTYNGYVWQILHQQSASDPNRRDVVLSSWSQGCTQATHKGLKTFG